MSLLLISRNCAVTLLPVFKFFRTSLLNVNEKLPVKLLKKLATALHEGNNKYQSLREYATLQEVFADFFLNLKLDIERSLLDHILSHANLCLQGYKASFSITSVCNTICETARVCLFGSIILYHIC